jgi:hypothetical protein
MTVSKQTHVEKRHTAFCAFLCMGKARVIGLQLGFFEARPGLGGRRRPAVCPTSFVHFRSISYFPSVFWMKDRSMGQ